MAAISERTFVIYCHWLESTFPETGGKIIFGVKYLFALGFFSFRFVSLTLSGAGSEVTLELKLPQKWFPTSYIYIAMTKMFQQKKVLYNICWIVSR